MHVRLLAGLALALLLFLVAASPAAAKPKPFVVILVEPEGTVATDLLAPYAILAESGAVEVKVVSPTAAPVRLTPGYAWVAPQMTLAQLARERPDGPDVVIVPAMENEADPVRAAWLRRQMAGGARIMSICNGARVLAAAGLLDGRRATIHWFSQARMARRHETTDWRRDVRWVSDGPITTTAGISAGEPGTLALLRDLTGEQVMRDTARRLGLPLPQQAHDGAAFRLTPGRMGVVVGNKAAFWRYEDVALPLSPGLDELAFGTALDAWSRTYRSTAWATGPAAVTSRHGLRLTRAASPPERFGRTVPLAGPDVMANTFEQIRRAYGEPTARFVAVQFEHPWGLAQS
ncbi:MAG TPA: DJ-1/PfpI family protein [Caulobacteraceae bacterium]|nr:DJ-1/PfpI family protein [Caulobacteraceae bacterium]